MSIPLYCANFFQLTFTDICAISTSVLFPALGVPPLASVHGGTFQGGEENRQPFPDGLLPNFGTSDHQPQPNSFVYFPKPSQFLPTLSIAPSCPLSSPLQGRPACSSHVCRL